MSRAGRPTGMHNDVTAAHQGNIVQAGHIGGSVYFADAALVQAQADSLAIHRKLEATYQRLDATQRQLIDLGRAGDLAGAAAEYQRLVRDRTYLSGPDHPDTLVARHELANWLGRTGDAGQALAEHESVTAARLRVLGAEHADTLRSRHRAARLTCEVLCTEVGLPLLRTVVAGKNTCTPCPVRQLCTTGTRRQITIRSRELHDALRNARVEQSTDQWKARYAARAGVEGTMRQTTHVTGIRQARYLGLPKTTLEHNIAAAAINMIRLDAYWTGHPLDRTRSSHLTRLDFTLTA